MKSVKISIVTPSFNQASFIEDTICSVIGQMYSGLEYIVIDGGSQDHSVDIIKKHEDQLAYWISKADKGQAHAINKGFAKATGDILAWLNSDDMYLPGTLEFVSDSLDVEKAEILIGNSLRFNVKKVMMWGTNVRSEAASFDLDYVDYIMQPSSFWTRKAWEVAGPLDENLHYGFDWEWYVRAKRKGVQFKIVDKYLSLYRIHEAHKSGIGGNKRHDELIEIYRRIHGNKISTLCKDLDGKSRTIRQIQYYLKKLRLSPFEKLFLYIRFPLIFSKYSFDEVMAVSKML